MALGDGKTRDGPDSSPDAGVKFDNEKDLEGNLPSSRRGSVNPSGRRLSRIDKKIEEADEDSEFGIGAQIEMEKDNAIKYRTCSWQKVRLRLFINSEAKTDGPQYYILFQNNSPSA